jgi:hypothetical protein
MLSMMEHLDNLNRTEDYLHGLYTLHRLQQETKVSKENLGNEKITIVHIEVPQFTMMSLASYLLSDPTAR